MNNLENLNYLKKLPMFRNFSQDNLTQISAVLKRLTFGKDSVIFEEKTSGESLFIIVKGKVRIEKKLDEKDFVKTLAVLQEGSFFGEMVLTSNNIRSARAVAETDVELLELKKNDFFSFIKKYPLSAIDFFTEMFEVLSYRLRATSRELTMVYDLSRLVFEKHKSEKVFLSRVLKELLPYLHGQWIICAYLYNMFNEEIELAALEGDEFFNINKLKDIKNNTPSYWIDDNTYLVVLPGSKQPDGYLVFRSEQELSVQDKSSLGISLSAVGHIVGSVVNNIRYQRENYLRDRLESQKQS